jgi:hypothetical protein
MIAHAPQLGQNAALFQQCIALCRECKDLCDIIPPVSVDPATIASLQADCDKCLEYGISEKSAAQLGEMKTELVEISEASAATDWGAVVGGGAVAGILALLLFGK